MSDEAPEKSLDTEILTRAKEKLKLYDQAWENVYKKAIEDQKFVAGDQWEESVVSQRKQDGRPCLTVNRLHQQVRHITNEQRQNRPAIKISPVDSGSDKELAEVRQGLIRSIWNISNADLAIDTAFEGAVEKSFGFYRVITDYCDPMSFDQEILVKPIANHFSVRIDPGFKEPDASDISGAFIIDKVLKDEFKAMYPDAELSQMHDWKDANDGDWIDDGTVRVAEFFEKEFKQIELVQFDNGVILEASDVKDIPEGVKETSRRKSLKPVIKWYKLNGIEILDRKEWPGSWIPVIAVFGAMKIIDGERVVESAIRHSIDSQKTLNYMTSAEAEAIALAPKAPWVAALGQIPKQHEKAWRESNVKSQAVLYYEAKDVNGQLAPPPQRVNAEANISAITSAKMQASDDIKSTTGQFDAAMGEQSNETSGIAIARRNTQSQTANFHFVDNLSRAIRHTGRIINELIPIIYDAERTVRILGEDDAEKIVTVNKQYQENGENKYYNMQVGKYDVVVEVGPNYATKRQEAAADMMELLKAMPQVAPVIADLVVRSMDWPQTDEIADRLKLTVNPAFLSDKDKPKGASPEQLQGQLQQQSQMMQQLSQQLQQAQQIIQTKQLEIKSKETIELAKLDVELAIAQQKITHEVDQNVFIESVAMLHKKLDQLGLSASETEDQQEQQDENFNESGDEAATQTNEEL